MFRGRGLLRTTNWFVSLFLMALVSGVSFSNFLQFGGKKQLHDGFFLPVQQLLFRDYPQVLGSMEILLVLLLIGLFISARSAKKVYACLFVSLLCVAAMIAVQGLYLYPLDIQISTWTRDTMPSNWPWFRDHWHALHIVRFCLSGIALAALIIAAFSRHEGSGREENGKRS